MKKPDSLRAALVASVPSLAQDPQNLIMWVDQGTIASPMTDHFHFAYSYRLNVLLLGYGEHQSLLAIAMLAWMRVNQPDLLQVGKDAIAFDADYLDNGSVDLQFTVQLMEQVRTVRREDGGFDMEFVAEPDPLFDDDVPLTADGDGGVPALTDLWFRGERLLPDAPLAVDAP